MRVKNNRVYIPILLIISGCGAQVLQGKSGTNGINGSNGKDGASCTVTKSNSVVSISCPDGTKQTIEDGTNGDSGLNSVISLIQATDTQCSNGGYVLAIGLDSNKNGILDTSDTYIQTAIICNGVNGQTGSKGDTGTSVQPSSLTPVDYITPCGASSSPYKEVLLLLEDGSLLASFSDNVNGYNTRLAFIPDGSYQDTDSSHCSFVVSTNGNTRSITWSGGGKTWNI